MQVRKRQLSSKEIERKKNYSCSVGYRHNFLMNQNKNKATLVHLKIDSEDFHKNKKLNFYVRKIIVMNLPFAEHSNHNRNFLLQFLFIRII